MGGGISLVQTDTLNDLLRLNFMKIPKNSTLNMILLDDFARRTLLDFLIYEHAEENLLFYEDYETLKFVERVDGADTLFFDAYKALLRKYIDTGAPQEINISQRLKDALLNLEIRKDKKMRVSRLQVERELGKAQHEVIEIMSGCLVRFQKSEILQSFMTSPSTVVIEPQGAQRFIKHAVLRKKPLLLVEKDELLSMILMKLLCDRNYEVTTAATGAAASALLMNSLFETVLICLELPDKSGIRVMQDFLRYEDRCKEKIPYYKRPFFIASTIKSGDSTETVATSSGFNAVLVKPFRMVDFHRLRPEEAKSMRLSRRLSRKVSLEQQLQSVVGGSSKGGGGILSFPSGDGASTRIGAAMGMIRRGPSGDGAMVVGSNKRMGSGDLAAVAR